MPSTHKQQSTLLKYLKELASESLSSSVSANEFIPKTIPNKKTRRATEDARKGKTKKAKNFDNLCEQLGI